MRRRGDSPDSRRRTPNATDGTSNGNGQQQGQGARSQPTLATMDDLAQIDALLAFAAGKKTLRLEHFHPPNAITLPRQARDKQREGTQKREWRFLVGLNLGQGMGFVFLDKRVSTELWLTKQFRGLVVIVMAFTLTFVLVGSAWD